MRVLLFIDSNVKTIPYEVPLLELKNRGHEIFFLSILESGAIHHEYRQYDMPVFSMDEKNITLKRILKYARFFVAFCAKQKVDVVFAHLTIPSLISVLAQYFIKAKVVCFRHHFNFVGLSHKKKHRINKIETAIDKVNASLARKLILPSEYLRQLIQVDEGVPLCKMSVIPYVYNWNDFLERVDSRTCFDRDTTPLKLLVISRLTKLKRPELALELLSVLHKHNIKAELTILGTGNLTSELKSYSESLGISEYVRFDGFQEDVVPYINRADILIHPSLTEASSSVIKEAGVLGCPVIVCNGVGDFNDYIIDGVNSWLVDADEFTKEAQAILQASDCQKRKQVGRELQKTILERFSLTDSVVSSYEALVYQSSTK